MQLQLYRYQITIKQLSLFLLPAVQQYTAFDSSTAVYFYCQQNNSTAVATKNSTTGRARYSWGKVLILYTNLFD